MSVTSASRDVEADRATLRAVHAALTGGDVARAQAMAAHALADGVVHPMVLDLAAGRLEGLGRLDEACALLARAAEMAPQAPGIRNAYGLILQRLDRMEEALAEFDAAIAAEPGFAPAWSNRAVSLMGLARLNDARRDFEHALGLQPGNPVALNGLAHLAIRRGAPEEARSLAAQAFERAPGFPPTQLILAEAEVALGDGGAEPRLRALIKDGALPPQDLATATGLLGDALDAQGRHAEAFEAWTEAGETARAAHAPQFGGRPGTLAAVRDMTALLDRRSFATVEGAGKGPAKTHVFLVGFPRSGTTLLEQVLEQHDEIVTLAEKECLVDGARALLADRDKFAAFCALPDAGLDQYRAAYWRRVAEQGVDPAGKVFVDKHPFHSFKLPLIARLFPDARILFAERDPRDTVLSCFRRRFRMNDPNYQMLTLAGAAELFAAAMELRAASEAALPMHAQTCRLEDMIGDFDGTTRAVCAHLGVEWSAKMRDFAANVAQRGVFTPSGAQLARGLNAEGVGKWRDYAAQMAPVLPLLEPWGK
ncbi:sulfotransferase [Sphingomonas sp. LB-2]|uniref:tetratricopeptide repeat-containing sulfotransferase family protein n=1 Tax=Sphingomonas caeni TaxID=2984949 RepID=UPI002231EEA3|nr:tetratricopeptide repeat-containing sulfotransferase family protein [Sphingomonas caeni]MCW3846273.1 sulfotransferase [Sphingomonas caeni]